MLAQSLPGGHASFTPEKQRQLLLHEAKQPYQVESERDVPKARQGELLVKVLAVGLNPIDWKSAQYGFGIPSLPCINGRELVGRVVSRDQSQRPDIEIGDAILSICTDYRDFRKSAFQEYAIATDFNAIKLPPQIDYAHAASIGVAFVAAALSLGICFGVTFPIANKDETLDLLEVAKSQGRDKIPQDTVEEVFNSIDPWNRPHAGEWILIYGASSITAQIAIQLARWAHLRVIAVVDLDKHEERLRTLGADKLIDRKDLSAAASQIRTEIKAPIRFALDTIGPDTALWCHDLLASRTGIQCRPSLRHSASGTWAMGAVSSLPHLICLTGAPKVEESNVRLHSVPIKLFHEHEGVGRVLSGWLRDLLDSGELRLPETLFERGGLDVIGRSLERLRRGEVSGKRLVVRFEDL
ncbi:GroES-like protein [Polyplosphaeria fusca]|uniref:GroES-like protein n=1 Tax=Polyplosphaeria fusca TaxID=682080 RepID=A0A9P4UXP1_9PLEO|nr:GroES-like protein [Polyplosphaeria fusca]